MPILVAIGSGVFGWWGGGRISGFSSDFQRRPYNTLTLPRQRVIQSVKTEAKQQTCANDVRDVKSTQQQFELTLQRYT